MEVHFGCHSSTNTSDRGLLDFLYELHQRFDLESNSTETILTPRDELTLFKFIVRECQLTLSTDPCTAWISISLYRVFHRHLDASLEPLVAKVEECLLNWNLIDRVSMLQHLVNEFKNNIELKRIVFDTSYSIHSTSLDWFEHAVLQLLVLNKCPRIKFHFATCDEVAFFHFKQCTPDLIPRFKKCPILETVLSYVGLAVNLKDSLRLSRLINRPKRGLNRDAFVTLTHLAKETNLSAAQVAMSFSCRRKLSTTSPDDPIQKALEPWARGIDHLVECIQQCQDALSGLTDDSMLVTSGADDRMNWDEASASVRACIHTVCKLLRNPLVRDQNCPGDEDYEEAFCDQRLRQVKEFLIAQVKDITRSSVSTLSCDTPGRSVNRGGSLRGRGAKKLARFLLLAAQSTVHSDLPSPRTPSQQPCATMTPTTDGRHGEQLARFMFPSPGTIEANNLEQTKENTVPDDVMPTIIEEDTSSLPERPLFARFQSNLDWADDCWSPVHRGKRGVWSSAVLAHDTSSMPAWPTSIQVGNPPVVMKEESGTASASTTPTKPKRISLTGPRHLFSDQNSVSSDTSKKSFQASNSATSKRPPERPSLKKSRRHTSRTEDKSQRKLNDFFKPSHF